MAINLCALTIAILFIRPLCVRVESYLGMLQAKVQAMRSHGVGVYRCGSVVRGILIRILKLDTLTDLVPALYPGPHSLSIFN